MAIVRGSCFRRGALKFRVEMEDEIEMGRYVWVSKLFPVGVKQLKGFDTQRVARGLILLYSIIWLYKAVSIKAQENQNQHAGI